MGRIERVNQQVKREIGAIIQRDLGDPRLQFVSITDAIVSRDLRSAKIFFSVIGNQTNIHNAQNALNAARSMIRKLLGERMTMRYTPELTFYYDDSIDKHARIEETLQEIKGDLEDDS